MKLKRSDVSFSIARELKINGPKCAKDLEKLGFSYNTIHNSLSELRREGVIERDAESGRTVYYRYIKQENHLDYVWLYGEKIRAEQMIENCVWKQL